MLYEPVYENYYGNEKSIYSTSNGYYYDNFGIPADPYQSVFFESGLFRKHLSLVHTKTHSD